jgi:hypothetical protein
MRRQEQGEPFGCSDSITASEVCDEQQGVSSAFVREMLVPATRAEVDA